MFSQGSKLPRRASPKELGHPTKALLERLRILIPKAIEGMVLEILDTWTFWPNGPQPVPASLAEVHSPRPGIPM